MNYHRSTSKALLIIVLLATVAYGALVAAGGDNATPLTVIPTSTSHPSVYITPLALAPPATTVPQSDCGLLQGALIVVGGTDLEIEFALKVATRESNCRLTAYNGNSSTGDNSWGPFQLNYYTPDTRRAWQRAGILSQESNVASYTQAATNFLAAYRLYGGCPWTAPAYCD